MKNNEKSCQLIKTENKRLGADETRTRHFQIANLMLYQMSYGPDG